MPSAVYRHGTLIFFTALFLLCLSLAVWLDSYYIAVAPIVLAFFYAGWQRHSWVFYLLLASIPFSTEIQFSSSLGTDFPDELLMLLTAGLFFCYWRYEPRVMARGTLQHPLILLLIVGFAWALLATLFSTDHVLSTKFILARVWYFGAFVLAPLIVWRDPRSIRVSIMLLASAMIIVVALTMIRHAEFGFTFAGINPALNPFFRNHVNYSALLVCVVPIVFAASRMANSPRRRNALMLILGLLLAALLFSYARGAWLALVMGIAAYWLIRWRMLVIAYIVSILIVIAALFWIKSDDRYLEYAHDYRTTIFHQDFREHLRATYEFKDVSTAERFYRWIAGVRMIKEDPLTGFGPNTFYQNYKPYAVPAFKTWVSDNPEHSTVHNYYLMITIEQGIPGLLLFLLLTSAALYYAQQLFYRAASPFYRMSAMVTGVIMVMILTVNFLSDMIETDKVGSLFLLCISLLVTIDLQIRRRLDPAPDVKGVAEPITQ